MISLHDFCPSITLPFEPSSHQHSFITGLASPTSSFRPFSDHTDKTAKHPTQSPLPIKLLVSGVVPPNSLACRRRLLTDPAVVGEAAAGDERWRGKQRNISTRSVCSCPLSHTHWTVYNSRITTNVILRLQSPLAYLTDTRKAAKMSVKTVDVKPFQDQKPGT